ncbi:hypothetical protein K438DRAFT_1862696 [Mycena galopus ATCC 62051]|nr:hypothetical protein K438DRAFT_1862696 [Mycena galopus ATCC 62051]
MDKLPNELLNHICSFLEDRDLWKVIQLSSSFRRLAMLPYLARFGISEANIQSGTLSLSDSFFLIVVVAGISPIQRLVCYEKSSGPQLGYTVLVDILSATAPIPDIVIYNRHYMIQKSKETAYILSRIPSSATTSLVIRKGSFLYSSHPRSSPRIQWKVPFRSFRHSPTMMFLIVIFSIPLFLVYLVFGVINFAVLSMWVYRRISDPPWPQDERIVHDMHDTCSLSFSSWMRIQSLPEEHLTLVTLADHSSHRPEYLILEPVPGLTDSAYSAILTSLDLGMHIRHLAVHPKANLVYADLMALVSHHPHLTELQVSSDSIRRSSLTPLSIVAHPESKVQDLTAPPCYIPYLLPATPNAHRISLLFAPSSKRALSVPAFRSATFDLAAYHTALEAIASLPGTHPLTLDFTFRLTAASLPWDVLPSTDLEVGNDNSALLPETRLGRVKTLFLCCDGPARFRASDIRSVMPWLGLFPSLQRLAFLPGAVKRISVAERAALAEAICMTCRGIGGPHNIAFNND